MKELHLRLAEEHLKRLRQIEEPQGLSLLGSQARLLAQELQQPNSLLRAMRNLHENIAHSRTESAMSVALRSLAQEDRLQNKTLKAILDHHRSNLQPSAVRDALEALNSSPLHSTLLNALASSKGLRGLNVELQHTSLEKLIPSFLQINRHAPLSYAQDPIAPLQQLAQVQNPLSQLYSNSLRDILHSIQNAVLTHQFESSFLANVDRHIAEVRSAVEQEDTEEVEKTIKDLFLLLFEKLRQLAPNTISYDGMHSIIFAILLILIQLDDSSKMEKRGSEQIKQSQAELLSAIESIKPSQPGVAQGICIVKRKAHLYSRPSTKAARLVTLYPNQRATIIQKKGKWVYVTYFDYINALPVSGWILKKYVKCIEVKSMTTIETIQTVPLTQTSEGVIRVTGTRLPLDTILHHYQRGASPEEITNRFPAISLGQVHAVLAYYLSHQAELDAYLKEQEAADAAFLKQLDADPQYQADRVAFRERLMQRWADRQKNGG